MSNSLTNPPKKEFQSFHNFPIINDLDNFKADVAFLGIPFGDPYSMGEASNDQIFSYINYFFWNFYSI